MKNELIHIENEDFDLPNVDCWLIIIETKILEYIQHLHHQRQLHIVVQLHNGQWPEPNQLG